MARDDHGHVSLGRIDIGKLVAKVASERYEQRTGRAKKLTGVQLGYESRCSAPHAFDVMLGSQLGLGAYNALVERGLDGHMVSVAGQLDLRYVPFSELIDPKTLKTEIRFIAARQRLPPAGHAARHPPARALSPPGLTAFPAPGKLGAWRLLCPSGWTMNVRTSRTSPRS